MSTATLAARHPSVYWAVFATAMILPVFVWIRDPNGPRTLLARSAALPDYGAVPAFSLVERSGRAVQSTELEGGPYFADFIYTTCKGACPKLSAEMAKLARRLGSPARARLVSFSVDPVKDTPRALSEYASRFGASASDWLFLTGEFRAVRELIRDGFHLGVADPPADEPKLAGVITHSEKVVLVDANGHVRRYYDGDGENWQDAALDDLDRLSPVARPS